MIRPHGEIFLHVDDVYDDEFSLCEAIFFGGGVTVNQLRGHACGFCIEWLL